MDGERFETLRGGERTKTIAKCLKFPSNGERLELKTFPLTDNERIHLIIMFSMALLN